MSIYCALAGHLASSDTIFNGGHNFARCTRCNTDLVEQAGTWSTAPTGFRIVWRKAEGAEEGYSALGDVLDLATSLAAEPTLPAPKSAAEEAGDDTHVPVEQAAAEAEETAMPAPLERRRIDRRAPGGSHPNFGGPDRRRQPRRQEFGKRTGAKASSQS